MPEGWTAKNLNIVPVRGFRMRKYRPDGAVVRSSLEPSPVDLRNFFSVGDAGHAGASSSLAPPKWMREECVRHCLKRRPSSPAFTGRSGSSMRLRTATRSQRKA